MTHPPVVLIGTGEMGGVFARGLLKLGYPVIPVTRSVSMEAVAAEVPEPTLALVAVGEADLHPALSALPTRWKTRVGLLQNELLPRDWHSHDIQNPTVVSVWFEKKPGQEFKVLVPSPLFGPQAGLLHGALEALGIPSWGVADAQEMEFELVRKNLYILVTNIAGLALPEGTTVQTLWDDHRLLAEEVIEEILPIQAWLTGHQHPRDRLIAEMLAGMHGDPAHRCTGRSAPGRLARAIEHAEQGGIEVPTLRRLQREYVA